MKKIINIVFYNFYEENTEKRAACIFYRDGSVANVDYEDGITACEQIVKERNITSKDAFKQMINDEIVYVMSREDFINKYKEFVNNEPIERETINEAVVEAMPKQKTKADDRKTTSDEKELNNTKTAGKGIAARIKATDTDEDEDEDEDDYDEDYDDEDDSTYGTNSIIKVADEDEDEDDYDEDYDDEDEDEDDEDLIIENSSEKDSNETDTAKEVDEFDTDDYDDDYDDDFDETIEDNNVVEKEKPKKVGFFTRQINKLKKAKAGVKGLVVSLALLVGLGGAGYAIKGSKTGNMLKNSAKSITTNIDEDMALNNVMAADNYVVNLKESSQLAGVPTNVLKSTGTALKTGNNDDYNDYTYEQLLEVTDNEAQKTAMTNLGTTIFEFNGDFADAYVEEDKDIRAALKVEEVEALQVAYNDYSKDELKAIFNGTEVRADKMSMDYHAASMQLKGAYLIETSENPVDMSYLLETQEGKDFYNKYHTMYLEAKEATGQDRINKVNAFYAQVRQDFPITQEIRTEGIAHADAYAMLESYKLAVTPMIASAEMLFQNLELDYTLNDMEVDFINDIGLCNYADDTFERLETITLSADEDKTNPTELQYRNSLIKVLEAENHYVTDDAHRELTRLDRYQRLLEEFNLMNDFSLSGVGGGSASYTETESSVEDTIEWVETETSYETKTETHEEEIPEDEKAKIDEQTEKENEEAKQKAEEEAKEKEKELQEKANEEAKKKEEEVQKYNDQTQKDIDTANDKINNNNKDQDTSNDTKVNEKDFKNKNVDFDDDHSDKDGNLNDSVKDITTDGTNDKTNEELPDPNETGAEFDKNAPAYTESTNNTNNAVEFVDISEESTEETESEENTEESSSETQLRQDDTNTYSETSYTEYPEGTKFYDENGNVYDTYEEFINAEAAKKYVESLETSSTATETDANYQYTR